MRGLGALAVVPGLLAEAIALEAFDLSGDFALIGAFDLPDAFAVGRFGFCRDFVVILRPRRAYVSESSLTDGLAASSTKRR